LIEIKVSYYIFELLSALLTTDRLMLINVLYTVRHKNTPNFFLL